MVAVLLLLPLACTALRPPVARVGRVPRPRVALAALTIGVDWGEKRTGVCVGAGWSARPLETVLTPDGNATDAAVAVAAAGAREGADRFVVGLPLARYGGSTNQTDAARGFARLLARTAAPRGVALWDERFSSREAEALLARDGLGGADLKRALDAAAACAILDDYFDRGPDGAEVVAPPPPAGAAPPPTRLVGAAPPRSARARRYLEDG